MSSPKSARSGTYEKELELLLPDVETNKDAEQAGWVGKKDDMDAFRLCGYKM